MNSNDMTSLLPYGGVPRAVVVFVTDIVTETHRTGIGKLADVGWVIRLSERSILDNK